jgi:glycine/sarcosine N-methyltransferase
MLNATDFYNQAASYYDAMTRFNKRQNREREWIRLWRDKYHFESALDAGCGTGSTALALAAEGVRATGIDISDRMIVKAGDNACNLDIENVDFITSLFEDAGHKIDSKFDVIFCLGNSLVHIMPGLALEKTIDSFERLLNPDSVLIIQLLNYEKILNHKERIIDIHREGNTEFIRFYDFIGDILNFNILHIEWDNETVRHQLQTTQHYPYQLAELSEQLGKYNFVIEEIYGNIKMDSYNPETSPNLVVAARKTV